MELQRVQQTDGHSVAGRKTTEYRGMRVRVVGAGDEFFAGRD
jgi:hypothetical protein